MFHRHTMESVPRHLLMNMFVCSLLLLMSLCNSTLGIHIVNSGTDLLTEDSETGLSEDYTIPFKRKYLWFGPRLGRKKRTVNNEELTVEEYPDKGFVTEVTRYLPPWELLSLKARNRNTMNFTPRLGRANEDGMLGSRYPLAAARFGRQHNFIHFSPRLGRKLLLEQKS